MSTKKISGKPKRSLNNKDLTFKLHRYRKFRIWLVWPFAILLFIFARSTLLGFFVGIPIMVSGEVIRIWSHGYLRKIRRLASAGPYAYVRNPLYVGNFLIGLGFCVIIWHPAIIFFYVVGFSAIYLLTVKGEEEKLAFKFGEAYALYSKSVPRFIPRLTPYEARTHAKFSSHRVWGHGESITVMAMSVLLLVVYLRHVHFQVLNPIGVSSVIAFNLTIVLFLALLYTMTTRKTRGRIKFEKYQAYVERRWRNWQTRKT
jgi:protein-S-isoprenylcysteine O-methyltransferase Ste14